MKTVICRDLQGNDHEVPENELTFRISAYGVVVQDGKALISPQWDGYDIPGGGIEPYETLEEGLKREVQEETGFDIEQGELLLFTEDFFIHPNSMKSFHCLLFFYHCSVIGGELSDAGFDEHEKKYAKLAEWHDVSKVDGLKFYNPVDSPALIRKAAEL